MLHEQSSFLEKSPTTAIEISEAVLKTTIHIMCYDQKKSEIKLLILPPSSMTEDKRADVLYTVEVDQ